MKMIFLLVVSVLIISVAFAQDGEPPAADELNIWIENPNEKQDVVKIELVSPCWNAQSTNVNLHDITSNYPGETVYFSDNGRIGWNVPWKPTGHNFALGKYKLTVTQGYLSDYCYIDYRTSAMPELYTGSYDLYLYYHAEVGVLYWDANYSDPVPTDFAIWQKKDIPNYKTELEPFSPYYLDLYPDVNPVLYWDHSPEEDYITGYAIYRSIVQRNEGPGMYYKIATVSSTSTSFTDFDLMVGGNDRAFYKLTAINGIRESYPTDEVYVDASPYKKNISFIQYKFCLLQNFPNPFNPTTTIKYSIPSELNVEISLFDFLGKKIAVLQNGIKQAGEYEFKINASDIASGIYYYIMKAGNYQFTRKLIIVK